MASKQVSFANFICKFGEDKNLLDVAEQIILPAFLDSESLKPRSFKDTEYFFYQPTLLNLGKASAPVLAIAGRFIKDTTLRREQIFTPGKGLVKTSGKLESSPSAIFVLLLNSHKLIYYPETAHGPSLSSFRSTAYSYIRQRQNKFIDEEFLRLQTEREEILARGREDVQKVTKKMLWDEYPFPSLEVVSIPSALSLYEFVRRYKQLSSISLRVLQTNSEIDNSNLLRAMRKTGGQLGAKNSQITHSAGDKQGLNKNEAVAQLHAVARDGNVEVKLSGKDVSGNRLVGNNEEFKLRVAIDNVSSDVDAAAMQLNNVLNKEIENSNIELAPDANLAKTNEIIRRIAKARNV
ncbi:hypothetical protein ABH945_001776 [Paraburkholderia sp. GAS333]|uniref:hypothetical protein n=1 Tax=Paraburkholderia sp. GAS333 TaxID=3156279 RepID=UPI003D1FD63E